MKKINQQWGSHLYRLFLLVIMFGVLWQKGYLWSAFLMALLLFLADTLFFPIVRIASNMSARIFRPEAVETVAAGDSPISGPGGRGFAQRSRRRR